MNNYDFSTLNDKEFEELCRDVLKQTLNIDFQNFKSGKDAGIDLRYSSPINNNNIIVQVKHYLKSGVSKLLHDLQQKEKPKLDILKPDQYLIVTSVSLSPKNKDRIKEIFTPYIKSTNDIYGQEDLNKYILEFNSIEKNHFKLWLSSINTLQIILSNSIYSKSYFLENKIKKQIGLYVRNNTYNEAVQILNTYKYLLITGQPGVGKTTLSYMLTFELLAKGYKLYYLDTDISEVDDCLSIDENEKQLFLLDDFLGANYHEILSASSKDSKIVSFLERINLTPNKLCILTTRTTILNKAKLLSEKFKSANIDIAKMELELKSYTTKDRALILYNHLYHNSLPEKYIKVIFKNKSYWKIINHKNYNPRVIEFITKENNLTKIKAKDYFNFIEDQLDNPKEIWNHSFYQQIEQDDRILIYTLFSFKNDVASGILEKAFKSRLDYEVKNNGYTIKHDSFNLSLKRLIDGYINSNRNSKYNSFSFINPSIKDFLILQLKSSKEERAKFYKSFIYYTQYEKLIELYISNEFKIITDSFEEASDLMDTLFINKDKILFNDRELNHDYSLSFKYLSITALINSLSNLNKELKIKADIYIYSILESINFIEINNSFIDEFISSINNPHKNGKVYKFIKDNITNVLPYLITDISYSNEISELLQTLKKFGISFSKNYTDSQIEHDLIEKAYECLYNDIDEYIKDNKYSIYDDYDYYELETKTKDFWNDQIDEMGLSDYEFEFNSGEYFNDHNHTE